MVRGVRIIAVLILWLITATILTTALSWRWSPVWMSWGVPSMAPSFFDLRSITAGVKTMHEGGDPLVANPNDKMQRPVNYPRVWLYLFSMLRINDKNLPVVGAVFCVLYLLCVSNLILRSRGSIEAIILLLGGLSSASLLAIERGNNDLLVFAIVFLGCIATSRWVKLPAYSVAALLKLFPFVAMMVHAIRKRGKERTIPAILTVLIIGSFVLQWRDINAIRRGTPIDPGLSYGVLSLKTQALSSNGEVAAIAVVICSWLVVALIVRKAWLRSPRFEQVMLDSNASEMFSVFGGIYVFSFITGCNYDYRLTFLLPTLPLAFKWVRNSRQALLGCVYIGLVLVAENALGFPTRYASLTVDVTTLAITILVLSVLTEQAKNSLLSADTPEEVISKPEMSDV